MKIEIARKKIMEKDYHDSGKAMVQSMLMAWLEYGGEKVAEAICKEAKKDIVSDSYLAIREAARKKGSNSVYMAPDESMVAMMGYFGYSEDDARQELEAGLMYAVMMSQSNQWKPYGTEDTKAQPVADFARQKADPGGSLDDLSLEDML